MNSNLKLKKKVNIFNNILKENFNKFLFIIKQIFFFMCNFIFHLGILCLSIKYHFCFQWLLIYGLILITTAITINLIGIYRSERLPIDDEEAKKLNIHNIKEYINFVYNYMKIKNSIILQILLFMNEINLNLYLTDKHFEYMENLVKKQYGENVKVKFSNDSKYCFCGFYDNLSIVKVFNLSFNNKQVKNIGNIKFDNSFFCGERLWKI